jgi:outer membrane protein assembly factor BamB
MNHMKNISSFLVLMIVSVGALYGTTPARAGTVYGDVNLDGQFTLADLNNLVDWLLLRTAPAPVGSPAFIRADVNGDGSVSLADLNLFVDRLLMRITWFPAETPNGLILTSPNGGQNWPAGTSQAVRWQAGTAIGHVNIDLSRNGGTTWESVAASIDAVPGSYAWTVMGAGSTNCIFRVSATANGTITSRSPAPFTISALSVSSPNGGETWRIGSTHTMVWNSLGVTSAQIELSRDGGGSWGMMASTVSAASGTWSWNVAGQASSNCLIRVSGAGTGTPSDTSNAAFAILPLPTVTATAPADGAQRILPGATVGVTFSEAMDHASAESAFSITGGVSGTFSWSGNTMVFNPSAALAQATSYTVTVAVTAMAAVDNVGLIAPCSFTFATGDFIPPRVTAMTPAPGALLTAVPSNIVVTFSKDIDPATINTSTIRLMRSGFDGTFGDGNEAAITPVSVTRTAANQATLDLTGLVLPDDDYRVIAQATTGGKALSFDGIDDYISAPQWLTGTTNQVTLECWARPMWDSWGPMVLHRASYNDMYFGWNSTTKTFQFAVPLDHAAQYQDDSFQLGTWYHVAGTYNGSTVNLYINGVLKASIPFTGNVNWDSAYMGSYIGGDGNGPWGGYFPGQLDEVRIWNIARSQAQIQSTMNRSLTGSEAGLRGYYRFDDGAGQVAHDSSPAGKHSTLGTSAAADAADPVWIDSSAPIRDGVKDLAGNVLDGDFIGAFPSGDGIEGGDFITTFTLSAQAPSVVSTYPANGVTGVQLGAPIRVIFSERMTPAATGGAFSITGGISGSISWTSGNTIVFTPSAPLMLSTIYGVTISTSAVDFTGTAMAAPYSFSFTTQPPAAPSILTQPVSATVAIGATVLFSVTATGLPMPSYQWQSYSGSSWNDIPGASANNYTTPAVTLGDTGKQFRCVVTNIAGTVYSQPATLYVLAPDITTGLAGWWKLSEMSDGSFPVTRADSSGNGYNLTDYTRAGTTFTQTDMGHLYNYSGRFVNANMNWLGIANAPLIEPTDYITHATWVNLASFPQNGWSYYIAVSSGAEGGSNARVNWYWGLSYVDASHLSLFTFVWDNTYGMQNYASTTSYTFEASTGTWYHVGFTFTKDTGTVTLYLNGVNVSSASNPLVKIMYGPGVAVTIGGNGATGSHAQGFLDGDMDDYRIYRRTLTDADMSALYNYSGSIAPKPPWITMQPASQSVALGQSAVFSIAVTGAAPLNYQWRIDAGSGWNDISGATNQSYTTPATLANDNGALFDCVVTNISGSMTSHAATLTVISDPMITRQPLNVTTLVGFPATFTVAAAGTAQLAYQWQRNGIDIPGATNASYIISTTSLSDGGSVFRCVVTNGVDQLVSHSATLTVGVSGLAKSAWPVRGYNERHTGQSPYVGPQTNHVAWTFTTSWGFGYWAPVIDANGVLYTGDWNSSLYAINPNGTVKWTYASQTQDNSTFSPCIGRDGTIYCRGATDRLVALRPENGTEKWGMTVGKTDKLNPSANIASDGTIYVGTLDGYLFAINPTDGSLKWKFNAGEQIASSPSIALDGTIYFGTEGTGVSLVAIDPSGNLKWRFVTGARVRGAPAVADDGTVYINSTDHNLYAVNPDGSKKWSYPTGGCEVGPAIAADGTIVTAVGTPGNFPQTGFAAFTPDGALKWYYPVGAGIITLPAISTNGIVYVGSWDSQIRALRLSDGTLVWSINTGGMIECNPLIGSDGTLYIGSNDGHLYAIHDSP